MKLVLPEGDIDFIVAGPVTREPVQERLDIDGIAVPLEATAEILAKKILYRAASFKPRDVFDVVRGLACDPAAARKAIDATKPVHPVLLRRLASLRKLDESVLLDDIDVTSSGRLYLVGMIDRLVGAVRSKT